MVVDSKLEICILVTYSLGTIIGCAFQVLCGVGSGWRDVSQKACLVGTKLFDVGWVTMAKSTCFSLSVYYFYLFVITNFEIEASERWKH